MDAFKVLFDDNNAAISAQRVDSAEYKTLTEFGMREGRQVILWFIVEADNETEAMDIAAKVVTKIWGTMLGLSREK